MKSESIQQPNSKKMNNNPPPPDQHKFLPKRIILVRHGESAGNLDGAAYTHTPDYKIPLTPEGIKQAKLAGARIRDVISDSGKLRNWKVCLYVSPYERTRSTLREIGGSFPRKRVIGVREECRIREQDFGNFQITERMKVIKETRERFGRFFYRFPEGESAADVFDRVSSFLESLWRDIDSRLHYDPKDDLNIILVSHGLTSRVFLMKWFKWTVEQFEYLNNFNNCEFRVMQLGDGGEYSLAVHHSDQQMQEWGLTAEMIADQKCRANATKGVTIEKCPWYMDHFIDHFESDSDEDRNKTTTTVSGNPLMKKCLCGCDAMLQTSWTSSNPGRRFYCCSRKVKNCGFIDWFDPALCERAKMIIPGLLKSKNKLEKEHRRLKLLVCLTWLGIGIFFLFSLKNKSAN